MMKMMLKTMAVAAALTVATAPFAMAQSNPTVGGAAMSPQKTIVANAVNSPINTTLVAAVKAAGLVDTLNGAGPFTVFAPTNAAFDRLPAGTVATFLKPENKAKLVKVLTAHVVAGKMSAGQILGKAIAMGGKYPMKTVSGDTIVAVPQGKGLALIDENGGKAVVTIADVNQSNGVIHVVNNVLVPK